MFECTPDVGEQLARAAGHPRTRKTDGPRPALFEGLLLTHAHMGHYAGLLELGREAYAAHAVPTWVTPRFSRFLRENGPWSLLVEAGHIELHELRSDIEVALASDLAVSAFEVPHRDEFSDTVGFVIHGPRRTLVYLPDIDKWETWDARAGPGQLERLLASADVALLDGTFFADGEIPGRSMRDIPHPFIVESLARLNRLAPSERAKIHFTHLNHTNPAADEDGDARRAIRAAGMHVLAEGTLFEL
jgi:pyrroloquinoline quinone biosynthesis protein B